MGRSDHQPTERSGRLTVGYVGDASGSSRGALAVTVGFRPARLRPVVRPWQGLWNSFGGELVGRDQAEEIPAILTEVRIVERLALGDRPFVGRADGPSPKPSTIPTPWSASTVRSRRSGRVERRYGASFQTSPFQAAPVGTSLASSADCGLKSSRTTTPFRERILLDVLEVSDDLAELVEAIDHRDVDAPSCGGPPRQDSRRSRQRSPRKTPRPPAGCSSRAPERGRRRSCVPP